MANKKKCKLCKQSMRWTLPERITEKNYEYAQYCLLMAKNTLVCGHTMKTKGIEHEQYCKHYRQKDERELDIDVKCESKRILDLENMISKYEKENKT